MVFPKKNSGYPRFLGKWAQIVQISTFSILLENFRSTVLDREVKSSVINVFFCILRENWSIINLVLFGRLRTTTLPNFRVGKTRFLEKVVVVSKFNEKCSFMDFSEKLVH